MLYFHVFAGLKMRKLDELFSAFFLWEEGGGVWFKDCANVYRQFNSSVFSLIVASA